MIEELNKAYCEYKRMGAMPFKRGDSKKIYYEYLKARKIFFDLLVKAMSQNVISSDSADRIAKALKEESVDPIAFWGSEKIASTNHFAYVADKEGRLFEALLKAYEKDVRKHHESNRT